ncbi:SGNH/GDSL hydrolase family protein [Streptomyces sp. NPDC046203]|uniref:SGNH/GDSL hydrolase family protein n=1 Tax=Streptomyces sp. NPDC046203 TaxID=3154602 RepID=UPI0033DAC278
MIRLADTPMTWVAAGDSITQGVLHTHGARGWVEHVHERVGWQLGRTTDVLVNSGVSGWTAVDVLASYEWLIGRFRPDVLSVSLGTNDCLAGEAGLPAFRDAMRAIVERARTAGGTQIVLHTPLVVGFSGRARRAAMPAYCQVVRELAAESGALLVDHEAYWIAHHGTEDPMAWLDEAAHPNGAGHLEMANHALRTMGLGELELP